MKNLFLEKFKDNLLNIYHKKSGKPVAMENMNINCKRDLDQQLEKLLYNLSLTSQLLTNAYENNDELAMKSALIGIRAQAMSLSSFFDNIKEDVENLVLLKSWQKFPEDYKLPDHYNYPLK